MLLIVVALLALLVHLYVCRGQGTHWLSSRLATEPRSRSFVSLTTTPQRLVSPWFETVFLKNLVQMAGASHTILLQIPHISSKGEVYAIPTNIQDVQSSHFQIRRLDVDEGPITKVMPALRDPGIQDEDTIIVCDDDIIYRTRTFDLLRSSVDQFPMSVSCMCTANIAGFKAFAFRKGVLKGLVSLEIPSSCRRIDDDLLEWYAKHRNIPLVAVPYEGDAQWTCSMHREITDTHPTWDELGKEDGNRDVMRQGCFRALNAHQT